MSTKKYFRKSQLKTLISDHPALVIAVLVVLGLGIVYVAAFVVPGIVVSSTLVPRATTRLQLQNGVRLALLPGLAAALFLATAYLSLRQLRMTANQVTVSQHQLDVARQGQAIERFARSVEQLASSELEVRLGGLYSLEQLARNDESYTVPVIEILAAYIRSRSPWPPRHPGQYLAEVDIGMIPALGIRASDIQICLDIIIHLARDQEKIVEQLDLSHADLRSANLSKAKLRKVRLECSCLAGANLADSSWEESAFYDTDFRQAYAEYAAFPRSMFRGNIQVGSANFWGSSFSDSDLLHLNFSGAEVRGAKFSGTRLSHTDFSKASLHSANLDGAEIDNCKFIDASLMGASLKESKWRPEDAPDFTNAIADEETQWPEGFDPLASGVGIVCMLPGMMVLPGDMPVMLVTPAKRLRES